MSKEKQIDEMAKLICTYPQCIHHNIIGECANTECQTVDIAEHLYNAGYRKQEWISVDERLPKELTHIIVCDEDGSVGEAFCYKEGRFEWIASEEIAFVTHWMPLPEAPKGKDGE